MKIEELLSEAIALGTSNKPYLPQSKPELQKTGNLIVFPKATQS